MSRKIDKFTIMLMELNSSLSITDKKRYRKVCKDIEDLDNVINKLI